MWRAVITLGFLASITMRAQPTANSFLAGPERLEIVRRILRESPLIDGHNDLPWEFRKLASNRLDTIDLNRDTTAFGLVTDLPRLKAGEVGGQFWSVYVPGELTNGAAVTAVLEQIDFVHRMIGRYPQSLNWRSRRMTSRAFTVREKWRRSLGWREGIQSGIRWGRCG
jgi:membrane dipeptidase